MRKLAFASLFIVFNVAGCSDHVGENLKAAEAAIKTGEDYRQYLSLAERQGRSPEDAKRIQATQEKLERAEKFNATLKHIRGYIDKDGYQVRNLKVDLRELEKNFAFDGDVERGKQIKIESCEKLLAKGIKQMEIRGWVSGANVIDNGGIDEVWGEFNRYSCEKPDDTVMAAAASALLDGFIKRLMSFAKEKRAYERHDIGDQVYAIRSFVELFSSAESLDKNRSKSEEAFTQARKLLKSRCDTGSCFSGELERFEKSLTRGISG
ncbi:hypothetical protein [Paucibacter soli]|uniref:hypothetical protein n=1 Tax=Paucibacter soli TaxID=3133433 RepID=UPI0030A0635A